MLKRKWLGYFSCLTMIVASGLSACGSGSADNTAKNTVVSLNSLTALPDPSTLFQTSSSSSLSASHSAFLKSNVVSDTVPTLLSINSNNVDQYFWNHLISEINNEPSIIDQNVAEAFWEGENSCHMAQNVMDAFAHLQDSGTVTCFMKNIPSAQSGVSISGDATANDVFDQKEGDKWVKVTVSNFPDEQGGGVEDMNVFFHIFGKSSNEGSSGYAFDFYRCDPQGSSPLEFQQIRVNSSTGAYSYFGYNARNSEQSQSQISAFLTESTDGSIQFDLSQDRLLDNVFKQANGKFTGTFKDHMKVSGDQVINLHYDQTLDGSSIGKQKMISQFSGSGIEDVRFLQAGTAMSFESQDFSNTIYTEAEFQNDHYVALNSGTYFDLINQYDFSDSFFQSLNIDDSAESTLQHYDCNQPVDVSVSVDFSDPAIAGLPALCEIKFDDRNYCDSELVVEAQNAVTDFLMQQH